MIWPQHARRRFDQASLQALRRDQIAELVKCESKIGHVHECVGVLRAEDPLPPFVCFPVAFGGGAEIARMRQRRGVIAKVTERLHAVHSERAAAALEGTLAECLRSGVFAHRT